MTDEVIQREDTMLYRKPTADSDENAIADIWGQKLETCTVDAPEVDGLLAEGWVRHPSHIDHPPKPEEAVGFVPDRGRAEAELKAAHERAEELAADLKDAREHIAALESDLKAATELADAETKAKEAAEARVKELEAKPTLTTKK